MGREIQPDGAKIRRLREEKGWQVEDLAGKADCSLRTVHNIEKSRPCFKCTLVKFAQALGVEYKALLVGAEPEPVTKKKVVVLIAVAIDLDQLDQTDQLHAWVKKLTRRAGAEDGLEVIDVKTGSTEITIEMTEDDLERFLTNLGASGVGPIQEAIIALKILKVTLPTGEVMFEGRYDPKFRLSDPQDDNAD